MSRGHSCGHGLRGWGRVGWCLRRPGCGVLGGEHSFRSLLGGSCRCLLLPDCGWWSSHGWRCQGRAGWHWHERGHGLGRRSSCGRCRRGLSSTAGASKHNGPSGHSTWRPLGARNCRGGAACGAADKPGFGAGLPWYCSTCTGIVASVQPRLGAAPAFNQLAACVLDISCCAFVTASSAGGLLAPAAVPAASQELVA